MTISETMRRIEILLEKHCKKYMNDPISSAPKIDKDRPRRTPTTRQKLRIKQLKEEGYSIDEIVSKVPLSRSTIYRILNPDKVHKH